MKKLSISILLIVACFGVTTKLFSQKKKPNVLVIYTDDHRFTGIHALGGEAVLTPNMDNLAYEGIVFTKTYLQGAFSGATCIPSRAMLLTGRSVFELDGIGRNIPEKDKMMGEAFREAGYYSHIVGKWHQDDESLMRGFDSGGKIMGRSAYLVDHFRMPLWDWNKEGKYNPQDAYLMVYEENGKVVRRSFSKEDKRGPFGTEENGPHTSEIFADDASGFIKSYKNKKPFFLYLAFHAPHDPRQAPKAFKEMYPEKDMNLPPSYLPQHPFDKADLQVRDEALAVWPRTIAVSQKELSDYYAIITHLDEQIGRVIQALKASGQYENTIIILAGDSGLAVGNHGLMGKQNVYDEDGIHVPLIISGNLIKEKGKRMDAFSYTHDIFPTVCDLAGVPIPPSVSGLSLLPVIQGEKEQIRNFTYHAYKQYERAYRKGDYKLIEFVRAKDANNEDGEFTAGSRVTLLFNVTEDPWETNDLSWKAEHTTRVLQMRSEMIEKSIELNDENKHLGFEYNFWDYFY